MSASWGTACRISQIRKVQFLFTVSVLDLGRGKCNLYRQNAAFESARGTGEGGRKKGIAAVGRAWQQQGGYGLVVHVPRYRMVCFGRNLRQVEGAGVDTVEVARSCQFVTLHRKKGLNRVQDLLAKWGPLKFFSSG